MSIGIYKITNNLNNKVYIGQSRNIERRWEEHINQNKNSVIHSAIVKYGIKNFSFEILEECNIEELDDKEIKWIKYYNSYQDGYNCTLGGRGGKKYDNLDEIYNDYLKTQSIAVTAKNLNMSSGTVRNILHIFNIHNEPNEKKKIQKINPFTLSIEKTYSSLEEAAKDCNCSVSNISLALNDKIESASGYFWQFYGENKNFSKCKVNKNGGVKVCQLDFETYDLINIFNTASEAAEKVTGKKSNNSGIISACKGKRINGYGYRWMYEEDYKKFLEQKDKKEENKIENPINIKKKSWKRKVAQLDLNSKEIIQVFDSVTAAANFFNSTDKSGIGKVCRGERLSYKGFGWKYID